MYIIFTIEFLISLLLVYWFDCLSFFIHKFIKSTSITQTERWFFIHMLCNLIITSLSYFDLTMCIENIQKCDSYNYLEYSNYIFTIAKASHIYHLAFFRKLSYDEYLHHVVMCLFCGPLTYYFSNTRMSAATMFFLTGLPGLIDYTNLYLVKLGFLSSYTQKYIYFFINLCIRSPMLLFLSISQLLYNNSQNDLEYTIRTILAMTVIWNSQYFLFLTVRDAIRKNIIG